MGRRCCRGCGSGSGRGARRFEMSKTISDDTMIAFEFLIEALADVEDEIKRLGAESFKEGAIDAVGQLRDQLRDIRVVRADVARLQETYVGKFIPNSTSETEPMGGLHTNDSLQLIMRYNGVMATGRWHGRSMTVLRDSTVRRQIWDSLSENLTELRRTCELDGTLEPTGQPDLLRLTKDLRFPSPSASAQFVAGCSVSGNREWQVDPNGQPLGQYIKKKSRSTPP
jgi:Domain of unknown function (DUF4357)